MRALLRFSSGRISAPLRSSLGPQVRGKKTTTEPVSAHPDLPEAQLGGKTLHELQDELQSVSKRMEQLQSAIRFFKDTKRKRILVLGAGPSPGPARMNDLWFSPIFIFI